ncbi:S-adenosyl-L-methionine-dependent methyltransferase [Gloeophyllum trabeum ATCC 11539]|uniref:Protein-lysine N-methyltransferase EFM4 n=1 Tax=Gloeophyllum trabeum (strain ATCC 11539 / FP-39264 / Madison 617) TaxID=670483 RepID=S7RNI4_GLOTA|nr:S-adenosyl-L-methionine-dependent methyltransferase [Gloeophyllum trabeum ATCC 11539]EPQ54329.1 S-adenosyl-L-methionine-dependent methyltransferase [Gloeophyllum trabeum ATCC 11539]
MSSVDLKPSKLGTKEHWDQVYEEELANFAENGDEGEIWFGQESIEKMVDWALEHVPPSRNPSILEIGSGNGTLLFALAENGYDAARIAGIDYSPDAVKLSKAIASSKNKGDIALNLCDFLNEVPPSIDATDAWDLLMDKGTFDAIALMERKPDGTIPRSKYSKRVASILKPGGHFLITSCNFTEEELKTEFLVAETGLEYHSRIQHPTFTYGGKTGSIVSTVAFRKRS